MDLGCSLVVACWLLVVGVAGVVRDRVVGIRLETLATLQVEWD